MVARGSGSIADIASIVSRPGIVICRVYAATKAALDGFASSQQAGH
jgi:short-subunit dehydrogenase